MGKLGVYCLKTLKKPSIYPLGNTPSAPSEWHWVSGYGEKREGGEECNPDGLRRDDEHDNHMCSISSADYAKFNFDGIQLQYIRQTEG